MRLLTAALILSLVVAVTASVFATWASVADAPWEEAVAVPTARPEPTPDPCIRLRDQLAQTSNVRSTYVIDQEGQREGCW